MYSSKITGLGHYVPENVVTNKDLEQYMETSDEWIQERTGIKERRWIPEGSEDTPSVMGTKAARMALDKAGITADDVDFIIFATLSPDYYFPGPGVMVQKQLGIKEVGALDVRNQCSGFLYSLSVADQYIKAGMYKNILVIGAENHSGGLERSNRGRGVTVIFGDGAGAVVLRGVEITDPDKQSHLISTKIHCDGRQAKELWCPGPGIGLKRKERATIDMLDEGLQYPQMNGRAIFSTAVRTMSESLLESLTSNGKTLDDLDLSFFHQANRRITEAIGKTANLTDDLIHSTVEKFGNTTSATIPIGLDDAVKNGKLKDGMLISNVAFGGGFTWGHALIRW
jgi:3-oxoacyl-[acyl-carrier-protein] synthase-3